MVVNSNFLEVKSRKIPFTEDGFLQNPEDWDEDVAEALAHRERISLTPEHWEILYFLRDYYHQFQQPPPNMRLFIKAVQKRFGREKGSSCYLSRLFPNSSLRRAALLAGLPKPPNCL